MKVWRNRITKRHGNNTGYHWLGPRIDIERGWPTDNGFREQVQLRYNDEGRNWLCFFGKLAQFGVGLDVLPPRGISVGLDATLDDCGLRFEVRLLVVSIDAWLRLGKDAV